MEKEFEWVYTILFLTIDLFNLFQLHALEAFDVCTEESATCLA